MGRCRRNMTIQNRILILCLALLARDVNAQGTPQTPTGFVSGTVRDEIGRPVRDALVVLDAETTPMRQRTTEDGRFRIDRVPVGGHELQVVRIGSSERAPLLNVVVQPNDWQKQVRAATQAISAKGALYVAFWTRFLERVHAEHPDWTQSKAAGPYNWFEMKSPIKGTTISHTFAQGERLRLELYIDSGERDRNDEIFQQLGAQREQIEAVYGRPLTWEELPDRRASRVAEYWDGCAVGDVDRHEEFINWFFDAGERLRTALKSASIV